MCRCEGCAGEVLHKLGAGAMEPLSGAKRSKTNNRGDIQCFLCKKYGHITVNCPLKAQQSVRARSKPVLIACTNPGEKLALREGYVEGKPVQILMDSSSKITVVKASLIDPKRWNWEELVRVQCVHGSEILYPSAQTRLETDGWGRTMKVALIPEVPIDILLGVRDSISPGQELKECLTVTTRESEYRLQQTPHRATSDSEGTQALMALHHIDSPEQAVIDTDGDESQYLLETGEPVTVPLDYQSLMPDQVTELQELLHKFPQLTSDKLGRTDVLEQTAAIPSSSGYATQDGNGD